MKLWNIANLVLRNEIRKYFEKKEEVGIIIIILDDFKFIINYGGYSLFAELYKHCNENVKKYYIDKLSSIKLNGI